MDSETSQIIKLQSQGLTAEQIAQALEKHPTVVDAVIKSHLKNASKVSFAQKYGDLENLIVNTYVDVMERSQNDSARVRAAELLDSKMENSGVNGAFDYNQILSTLKDVNKRLTVSDEDRKLLPLEADLIEC